jgi:hypothetical protein
MDKRISLSQVKSYLNEFLNVGVENFRLIRMCSNDIEYELNDNDSHLPFLSQNYKIIVKLGPALKANENSVPIYKFNKVTVS